MIRLIERSLDFSSRTAIESNDACYTYQDLLDESGRIAAHLLGGETDTKEEPIAFLCPPSFEYVAVQWAIWRAGGIAVPLCERHPLPAMEYVLNDTRTKRILVSRKYFAKLRSLGIPEKRQVLCTEDIKNGDSDHLPHVDQQRQAMILYTSGTTNLPKGVVTTHANISAQIISLVNAWEWNKDDIILNILPLHHVHGIINILSCALWTGAKCVFLPGFDGRQVFKELSSGRYNLFMAVPTIYYKLIREYENATEQEKKDFSLATSRFRLMVSGSAALPVPVLESWKNITGQTLLERYGMTEIGMALSNPYRGERRPGHVGLPLPEVEVCLMDENGNRLPQGEIGEIHVRGPQVFKEYWNKEEETRNAFTGAGWFKTGDVATVKDDYYKILGRSNIDIIKSGGYKLSALEIENVLLRHPLIGECAVIGIPDEQWGEIVGAAVVFDGPPISGDELRVWARQFLPDYKLPRCLIALRELPKNTLGKVVKTNLKTKFT